MRLTNKLLIIFSGTLLISFYANAQLFQAQISGGINLAQVEGDEVSGFWKPGFMGGVGVMMPLKPSKLTAPWRASLELLYSQRGAYEKMPTGVKAPFGYSLNLQFVDIPVMIHYKDPQLDLMFGLGLQYGRLFNIINEKWRLPDTAKVGWYRPVDTANMPAFNRNEFAIVVDCRIGIWQRLKCSLRWQYGLNSIRSRVSFYNGTTAGSSGSYIVERDYHNHWLSLRIIYVFNERLTKDKDRRIKRNLY
ncbi:MAG: PorT family protein [Bacteroidales bacterium]|jgi:hypothetical protein|nr:PorT family protein [Bacteroidales bacterium]